MNKKYLFVLFCFYFLTHAQTTKKVLFLGNSYTQYNNLPNLIEQAAISTNDALIHDSNLIGGYSLEQHASNQESISKINSNQWDYVVLQDQSQKPAFPLPYVNNFVFPYATQLTSIAKANFNCTVPVFYTTWGKKSGDAQICLNGQCTYEVMDNLLQERYRIMAETNNGLISPVAQVWRYIRENHPTIDLYVSDNSHPSLEGSMAAAYTFYSIIYRKDPTLVTYNSSLNANTASILKNAVKQVVYNNLEHFFVDVNDNFANFDAAVISASNFQFSNTTTNASNILWDFGDGTISNSLNPSHNFASAGSYTITLSLRVCGKTYTKTKNITISPLSNNEFTKEQVLVYPNPSSAILNVTVASFDKMVIYDMLGKQMDTAYNLTENGVQINIEQLVKGNYILQISKGEQTQKIKFIKD